MRIVQIVQAIGPGSGVAGVAWNLEREFRALGHTVEAFTYATAQRGRGHSWPTLRLARRVARAWGVVWFSTVGTRRARQYLADRPDAVSICHNNVLAGDVYVSHGVVTAAMNSLDHGWWRVLRNPTHAFVYVRDLWRFRRGIHKLVIALSGYEAAALRRTYGALRSPIEVIPNGVDTRIYHPPTCEERTHARAVFHLDDDDRIALFIGHEFERKGLRFAMEALIEAPSVMLLVVGGSADIMASAEAEAERLGVGERVMFVGPRHDLPLFFAAADMFVLPSSYESNALVILEALSSGLPVLSTPVGYAPEVIEDGRNGWIVGRSPAEIGQRFEQVAREPVGAFGEAARASVANLDWESVALRYVAVLEQLARGRDRTEWSG